MLLLLTILHRRLPHRVAHVSALAVADKASARTSLGTDGRGHEAAGPNHDSEVKDRGTKQGIDGSMAITPT